MGAKEMIKELLLFDLDGTLLLSNGTFSSKTIDILVKCKTKGYGIAIITARSHSQKNLDLIKYIPYDFIAFYNGAQIYANNRLIKSCLLTFEREISMLLNLHNDFPDLAIDVYQEPWHFLSTNNEIFHMKTHARTTCGISQLPNCDIQRIRLRSKHLSSIPLKNYMTNESAFYYTTQGDAIIVNKKANKGSAVQYIANFCHISTAKMIAFGDDVNDIEMFEKANIGIAMGNAVTTLKEVAYDITDTNDNDGVTSWIMQNILKKENT